jgi:regulator of protease activity HflC (stomatin/prohibitin superfamily)
MITMVPAEAAYVVERLGRYHRTLQAGTHLLLPLLDRVAFRLTLRPTSEAWSGKAITLDNVTVTVDAGVQWQIVNPERAAYNVADARQHLTAVVGNALRDAIGRQNWNDVRETTRELQQTVLRAAADEAERIGTKIDSVTVSRIART